MLANEPDLAHRAAAFHMEQFGPQVIGCCLPLHLLECMQNRFFASDFPPPSPPPMQGHSYDPSYQHIAKGPEEGFLPNLHQAAIRVETQNPSPCGSAAPDSAQNQPHPHPPAAFMIVIMAVSSRTEMATHTLPLASSLSHIPRPPRGGAVAPITAGAGSSGSGGKGGRREMEGQVPPYIYPMAEDCAEPAAKTSRGGLGIGGLSDTLVSAGESRGKSQEHLDR